MQSIVTKYLGATDSKGSRIKATAYAGSVTLAWNHELDATGNSIAAARALAEKLGWSGSWAMGTLPDSRDVFVPIVGKGSFTVRGAK